MSHPDESSEEQLAPWEKRFYEICRRVNQLLWVPDDFNGFGEYRCEELSVKEFMDLIITVCPKNEWRALVKQMDKPWIAYANSYIQNIIDGINKWRRKLGRRVNSHMEHVVLVAAEDTKQSKNPLSPKDFILKRIPGTLIRQRKLKITESQIVAQLMDMKLGSQFTVKEWYRKYVDAHRIEHLSQEQLDELTLPATANRKWFIEEAEKRIDVEPIKSDKKKPTKGKSNKQPATARMLKIYDGDTIPYPFKSKVKQYRKKKPNIPFVETPTQTRIDYAKVQRPSFSSARGAWEIDHCFNMAKPDDMWLFCVNVNTRYLVVFDHTNIDKQKQHEVANKTLESLMDLARTQLVTSIRGDGSTSYCPKRFRNRVLTPELLSDLSKRSKHGMLLGQGESYALLDWAQEKKISLYFNDSAFTLHNKLVDVAIKTIRNAIGYRIITTGQLQQIVDYYNNTVHKSIGCTPTEMQKNPDYEYQYIRWCERKLSDVLDYQRSQGYLDYKNGNILMVHIDTGKTADKMMKRRVFYDRLGEFVRYEYGNVVVRLFVPVKITNKKKKNGEEYEGEIFVTVPIYHTRFVAKNKESIPKNVADYHVDKAYVADKDID